MEGPGLPPLHNPGTPGGLSGASTLSVPSTSSQPDSSSPVGSGNFASLHMHPHLTPMKQKDIACSKSHLVLRMIEMRIGQEPLLQVCQQKDVRSDIVFLFSVEYLHMQWSRRGSYKFYGR